LEAQVPSPAPTSTIAAAPEASPELGKHFQGFSGAFVLYDLNDVEYGFLIEVR